MEIKISDFIRNPAIKLIELRGVLDLLASKEMNRQLFSIIEEGKSSLIADLTKLEYINSSGIYCLLECFSKAREKGGYLKLITAEGRVREILNLVGITKIIPLFDTLDKALDAPA